MCSGRASALVFTRIENQGSECSLPVRPSPHLSRTQFKTKWTFELLGFQEASGKFGDGDFLPIGFLFGERIGYIRECRLAVTKIDLRILDLGHTGCQRRWLTWLRCGCLLLEATVFLQDIDFGLCLTVFTSSVSNQLRMAFPPIAELFSPQGVRASKA